jgi:ABC-type sugar transport system permease subunit
VRTRVRSTSLDSERRARFPLATRQEIPDELYELAAIEGSGPLNVFRRIALPVMAPTLLLLLFRDTISASRRASSPRWS